MYQHSYRTSDFPFLTVDPTNPQALYVVYSEDPTGTDEADVVFQRSLVGGGAAGWLGTAIKINDDSTMEPQYFPVARAKQNSNGWTILDVLWADERNNIGCRIDDDSDGVTDEETADMVDEDSDGLTDEDLCTIQIDIYFSRSVDTHSATPTFSPNKRITTLSFGAPQVPPNFLGDYVDMLPFGSDDYAVWADTRGGDNDVYWDRIGDMDSDSDGTLDFPDCNPSDATVIAGPSVVQSVTVSKSGSNASVTWTSQDPTAGTGTVYDIVTGLVSQLKASGNYSNATCLVNNHGNTPYLDTRTPPPSGDAYYYLLRAHNSCGIGSFGSTGPADPRYALEGSTPCAQ